MLQASKLLLRQYKDGFRYTSDTMALYDFISQFKPKGRLLDIGSGCGVLGLLLHRDFDVNLSMVEIHERQAELCRQNADFNKITSDVATCDVMEFESEPFDVIVSNPPFYNPKNQKSGCEMRQKAMYGDEMRFDGLYKKVIKMLKPNGEFLFCYDARLLGSVISEINADKKAALTHLRFVHSKAQKPSKLALFRVKKGSKAELCVMPPLFMQDENGYVREAKEIFERANCESVDI